MLTPNTCLFPHSRFPHLVPVHTPYCPHLSIPTLLHFHTSSSPPPPPPFILHTLHFPHSRFSILPIFHLSNFPRSSYSTIHLFSHSYLSTLFNSSLHVFLRTPQFHTHTLLIFHTPGDIGLDFTKFFFSFHVPRFPLRNLVVCKLENFNFVPFLLRTASLRPNSHGHPLENYNIPPPCSYCMECFTYYLRGMP